MTRIEYFLTLDIPKPTLSEKEMQEYTTTKDIERRIYLANKAAHPKHKDLTTEQKIALYFQRRADEIQDERVEIGKDIGGRILPTPEEVMCGMYSARNLYEFEPFTCGIYMFYIEGKPNLKYVGSSYYIEYALHSHFCRWRSERTNPDKPRKSKSYLKPVRYLLDTYKDKVKFKVIEEVPYSLLDVACEYQREVNHCTWISENVKFNAEDWEAGKYYQ